MRNIFLIPDEKIPRQILVNSAPLASTFMSLIDQLEKRTATIGIVGLGYVGLPLVLAYAKAGCRTLGFDIDGKKIRKAFSSGQSYIRSAMTMSPQHRRAAY